MLPTDKTAMNHYLAGLIKECFYLMSGLTVFGFLQSLAVLTWLTPLLDTKVGAAIVAGVFMLAGRWLENRLTNNWRTRALKAESKLAGEVKENGP
jgi:hypothetical protein